MTKEQYVDHLIDSFISAEPGKIKELMRTIKTLSTLTTIKGKLNDSDQGS